ncbi:unnamed protein product [Phytophthora fragariaefolia]|uniref:Unnamed protein product n=1 Tax=Phytophthora fragariaefolia TaxID=1490495 RepID=A0A9W6WX57_9STRA|nr:unnamed protein product [Phytophthora fragariaefolia]
MARSPAAPPAAPPRSPAAPPRSSTAQSQSTPTRPARRNKNLTAVGRQRIVESLLRLAVNDNLSHGVLFGVAAEHGVHPSTVSRLWQRAKNEVQLTGLYVVFSRMHLSGRRPTDRTGELEQLRGVDVAARSTVRAAAAICDLPQTTLQRRIGTGELRKVTSVVKPLLTEENRNTRLHFCVSHIDRGTLLYADMLKTVHVDEKIFHVTETTRRFLLLPGEVAPTRRVKSRRYITRVMVLAAVARPRVDTVTQNYFDGQLGVWTFVEKVPAQRSSRRRPTGTLETTEVSVTKATYRDMLISRVLPAIEACWPNASEAVVIQQDNAPAHIKPDDPQFNDAAASCGRHV